MPRRFPVAPWLLAATLVAAAAAEASPVRILLGGHTRGQVVGQARRAGRVLALQQRLRREDPDLLLLSAGSDLGPSPTSDLDGGRAAVRLMNHAGLAAYGFGRKELFAGLENALERFAEMDFPVVATNVRLPDLGLQPAPRVVPALPLAHPGGDVLVLGLTAAESLRNEPDLDPRIHIEPIEEALRRHQVEGQVADLVVVLGNMGFGQASEVLESFPWVDLILCNRTPEDQAVRSSGLEYRLRDGRRVVWAPGWADELVEVSVRREGGRLVGETRPLPVPRDLPPAPAAEAALSDIRRRRLREDRDVLAQLSDAEMEDFGVTIAEAFRDAVGAEVGAVLRGSVMDVPARELTRQDLREAFPWTMHVVLLRLSGAELRRLWKRRDRGIDRDRHLALAGLREVRGQLRVNQRRLEDGEHYRVAVESFVAKGGWRILPEPRTGRRGPRIRELLTEFFQRPPGRLAAVRERARRPVRRTEVELDFSASQLAFGGSADAFQFRESNRFGSYSTVPGLIGLESSNVNYRLGWEREVDRPGSLLVGRVSANYSRYNDARYTDRLRGLLRWEGDDLDSAEPDWYAALGLQGTVTEPIGAGRERALFLQASGGKVWRIQGGKVLLGAGVLSRRADPGNPDSVGVDLGVEYTRDLGRGVELDLRGQLFEAADSTDVRMIDWRFELEMPVTHRFSAVLRQTGFRFKDRTVGDSATRGESYAGLRFRLDRRRY